MNRRMVGRIVKTNLDRACDGDGSLARCRRIPLYARAQPYLGHYRDVVSMTRARLHSALQSGERGV